MSESLPSSLPRKFRQAAITAVLAIAFLTALWAGGALSAQATPVGVPAAPDAASDHDNQGRGHPQGQGHGAGGVAELPEAVSDGGSSEAVPPPPDPALEGSSQDGGANSTLGPYDPTDPGASGVRQPSGNGKSTDNNGNRPCAGCVGKADLKNPPGQRPDGGDH